MAIIEIQQYMQRQLQWRRGNRQTDMKMYQRYKRVFQAKKTCTRSAIPLPLRALYFGVQYQI